MGADCAQIWVWVGGWGVKRVFSRFKSVYVGVFSFFWRFGWVWAGRRVDERWTRVVRTVKWWDTVGGKCRVMSGHVGSCRVMSGEVGVSRVK